jgi:hypothetical protein
MAITLYDAPVLLFVRHLKVLSHILKKAEEFAKEKGIDLADVPGWRLAEDMKPLSFQIWAACNTAKDTLEFFEVDSSPEEIEVEEKRLEDLQKRITDTLGLLQKIDRKALVGKEDEPVQIPVGAGTLNFTAQQAVLTMGVPNFYFHCAMAYAILRNKGVQVGKGDWLKGGQQWSELQ